MSDIVGVGQLRELAADIRSNESLYWRDNAEQLQRLRAPQVKPLWHALLASLLEEVPTSEWYNVVEVADASVEDRRCLEALAKLYRARKIYEKEAAVLIRIKDRFGETSSLLVNMARCAIKCKDLDLAHSHIAAAIALDPLSVKALNVALRVFEAQGADLREIDSIAMKLAHLDIDAALNEVGFLMSIGCYSTIASIFIKGRSVGKVIDQKLVDSLVKTFSRLADSDRDAGNLVRAAERYGLISSLIPKDKSSRGSRQQIIDELFVSARDRGASGQIPESLVYYRQILELDPSSLKAMRGAALCCEGLSDWEAACELWNEVYNRVAAGEQPAIIEKFAKAARNISSSVGRIRHLNLAAQRDPASSRIADLRAKALKHGLKEVRQLRDAERFDDALTYLHSLPLGVDDDGRFSEIKDSVVTRLARKMKECRESGLKHNTLSIARSILEVSPDHIPALKIVSDHETAERNFSGAEHHLRLMVNIEPENISYKLKHVKILRKLRRYEEALAALSLVLSVDPANASALELKRSIEAKA